MDAAGRKDALVLNAGMIVMCFRAQAVIAVQYLRHKPFLHHWTANFADVEISCLETRSLILTVTW